MSIGFDYLVHIYNKITDDEIWLGSEIKWTDIHLNKNPDIKMTNKNELLYLIPASLVFFTIRYIIKKYKNFKNIVLI